MGCCCNRVKNVYNETTPGKIEMTNGIPGAILSGLEEAFNADVDADSLTRVMYFLSDSISKKREEALSSLEKVLPNQVAFKKEAERMVEYTKAEDKDPEYRQMMNDVRNNFLKDTMTEHLDAGQRFQLTVPTDSSALVVSMYCFMRAVSSLPPDSYRALATQVSAMGGQVATYGGRALAYARKAKPGDMVDLLAVSLGPVIISNIKRWWAGEISGKRCVKNISDLGVPVAAGIVGGVGGKMIGAAVGSFFGPVGTAYGAVLGSVAAGVYVATTAESLCSMLTESVFGLPQSEALENAFTFLNVSPNASNSEINSQYRRLALKYHPDKGGDTKNWTRLQYSMAVIKESRVEL